MDWDHKRREMVDFLLGMPMETLMTRLEALRAQAERDREQLTKDHPTWDSGGDARLLPLVEFANHCEQADYSMSILRKMDQDDWYANSVASAAQLDPWHRFVLTGGFEGMVKFGFQMSVFTVIETSCRVFLRALDPKACNGATGPFARVSDCLLDSEHLGFVDKEEKRATELLELVRLIRNLIHNEGVYFYGDKKDRSVEYRSNSYTFRYGEPVTFVSWDLLLNLAQDIEWLLVRLARDPKMAVIDHVTSPLMPKVDQSR